MIRHLLLDLDNTLYPASGGMDAGVTRRMMQFVADYLSVSMEEAVRMRSMHLGKYGTTLEWLSVEHGLKDTATYFAAVHPPQELDELQKDPSLRPFLQSLGVPMTLLTNAPAAHAGRVLDFFGITDLFLGIFDIEYHGGRGKPHPDCFLETMRAVGKSIPETLFVDDHPKYLKGWQSLGGKGVLVNESLSLSALAEQEGYGIIRSIYELGHYLNTGNY